MRYMADKKINAACNKWEPTIASHIKRKGDIHMSSLEQSIKRYENKIKSCTTMTELLVNMSAWQKFAESHALSDEERAAVDQAYMEAEKSLITQVKSSLW